MTSFFKFEGEWASAPCPPAEKKTNFFVCALGAVNNGRFFVPRRKRAKCFQCWWFYPPPTLWKNFCGRPWCLSHTVTYSLRWNYAWLSGCSNPVYPILQNPDGLQHTQDWCLYCMSCMFSHCRSQIKITKAVISLTQIICEKLLSKSNCWCTVSK